MWAIRQVQANDASSLLRDARDYALVKGLVLRYNQNPNDNWVGQIPFTLFPSPFPRKLYQLCLDVQPTINELMLKIANDTQYIENSLADITKVDDFTKKLLDINLSVLREGRSQPIISCINRSDYMIHDSDRLAVGEDGLQVRQVEVNAIASSMSAHSYNTQLLHKYLMDKYRLNPIDGIYPSNDGLSMIARALIKAYEAYARPDTHILVVCEDRTSNFSDFIQIELLVHEIRSDIRFIRRRFRDLPETSRLGPNKNLLVDRKEIAVVYYRYGYDPSNYNFPGAWDQRLLLERSRAIKCPSINFHLSGVKKFQQLLNSETDLERFLNPKDASQLSRLFCKFWSIEANTQAGSEGYELGLNQSKSLVLKPQREGGGHNIYGEDIGPFLRQLARPQDRSQYIMMELINCPKEHNWLLLSDDQPTKEATRLGQPEHLISELGIFGNILADETKILSNEGAGYLVRSKRQGTNEGGVASGYAGISSLLLIDDDKMDLNDYFYK